MYVVFPCLSSDFPGFFFAMLIYHHNDLGTANNGLGGYTDVGCLRYSFFPNKVDGVFPRTGTPQYSKFWQKMHYC